MCLPEGPQRVLRFTRQSHHSCSLPALLPGASPASRSRVTARLAEQSTAAQVANCVSTVVPLTPHSGPDSTRIPPCKSAELYAATTYTQFATWAAYAIRCRLHGYGYSKRVRRLFEALATAINQQVAV